MLHLLHILLVIELVEPDKQAVYLHEVSQAKVLGRGPVADNAIERDDSQEVPDESSMEVNHGECPEVSFNLV